jgi:hypothetical protein
MTFIKGYYIVSAIISLILSYVSATLMFHGHVTPLNVLGFFSGFMSWLGIGAFIHFMNWDKAGI